MQFAEVTDDEAVLGMESFEVDALSNPYTSVIGSVAQEDFDTYTENITSFVAVPEAPKNTLEAAKFLRDAHDGPLDWHLLCLKLQRTARGLPAVYPSALSAARATPVPERVIKLQDLRRGMVAYCDDPRDSNPYGHIFFIAGRDHLGNVLTWTNDALRSGGVDVVPIDFFDKNWGDKFQFGATWLNGYDFSDPDLQPEPTRGTLGKNYHHAIEDVERSIKYHEDAGHPKLVQALQRDLKIMQRRAEHFS